ncbi:hypothetical protein N7E81_00340 [Reichenbachiella carrageenanivorans]|uniref:Glycosyl transferase family 2 n=1 Tax=Reichenbachiella carrageenanivorans TaxID=2979869 RepID=A0ABY6D062_9BACT|nr:hypothetical protein [Reichenbachiella carrageenanivorans]UXX79559.1 hypothetical protein N7E81_00340 [Reichenbachiella carrageenanivorans]
MKMTLLQNLNDNLIDRNSIEFVLMDFDEGDQVKQWVLKEFGEFLSDGYLKYFHCPQLSEWNASVAKNTSHKVAAGAVLVNLDCDNYTGLRGGAFVLDQFREAEQNIVLWQFSKIKEDGSFGRIAITRDLFKLLGGYNEAFLPMGYQDNDLMERAKARGALLVHRRDSDYNRAIPNEKYTPATMSYKKMKMTNKAASKKNIRLGHLMANAGLYGLEEVYKLSPGGQLERYEGAID